MSGGDGRSAEPSAGSGVIRLDPARRRVPVHQEPGAGPARVIPLVAPGDGTADVSVADLDDFDPRRMRRLPAPTADVLASGTGPLIAEQPPRMPMASLDDLAGSQGAGASGPRGAPVARVDVESLDGPAGVPVADLDEAGSGRPEVRTVAFAELAGPSRGRNDRRPGPGTEPTAEQRATRPRRCRPAPDPESVVAARRERLVRAFPELAARFGPLPDPDASPAADASPEAASADRAGDRGRTSPNRSAQRRTTREPRTHRLAGAPAEGPGRDVDPPADPVAVAREICLRLLTERARTRQELAQALRRKGVPEEAASAVLERFGEVGLIDDGAFAEQWVRSRHAYRGLGRRAIAVELRRKGVDDEVAREALTGIDADSERERARALVERKLRGLPVATADQRARAGRRLLGMLARKGYTAGTAYDVVRLALAENGADVEEFGAGWEHDD